MMGKTAGNHPNFFIRGYRYVFGIGYERNVGGTERVVRGGLGGLSLLAGIVIAAVPIMTASIANALIAALLVVNGLYLIYEARVQYCPLNHTLGRSTYKGK